MKTETHEVIITIPEMKAFIEDQRKANQQVFNERPDLKNALERIKEASDKVKTHWNTNNKIIRR